MNSKFKRTAILATVSLMACSTAEFRPRAVGALPGVQTADELLAEGRLDFRSRNFALAVQSFRRALRQDPNRIEAYNGLAASYDRLGRFDLARRYYEEALALAPADPRIRTNYAISLRMQGLEREAALLESDLGRPEPQMAQAPAEPAPSPALTIVLPPPAPAPAVAVPRLERISTNEVSLVTRSEPTSPEVDIARRVEPARAQPLPVRVVRDTSREVVIAIGDAPEPPRPTAALRPASPPRQAAPQPAAPRMVIAPDPAPRAVAPPPSPRERPVVVQLAERTMTPPVSAPPAPAPVRVIEPALPPRTPARPAVQAPAPAAPAPAPRLHARPAVQSPVQVAPAPARRVQASVVPTRAALPAPPAPVAIAARVAGTVQAVPARVATAVPPAQPGPVAARVTGTVQVALVPAAPTARPQRLTRVASPRPAPAPRSAFTPYSAFGPLDLVSRPESWQPLARPTQLAYVPLQALPLQAPMRILNAVGRRGQAARMQRHLLATGWDRTSIGDARSRRVRSILFTPPGTWRQAEALARALPFRPRLVRTSRPGQLLLVLGRDALPFDDRLRRWS